MEQRSGNEPKTVRWGVAGPGSVAPDHLIVTTPRGQERIEAPIGPGAFRFEIGEVHRCITEGLQQSPTMPLADSYELAETMDRIRAQIGLRYPGE